MPDYQDLYLTLFRATERAANILLQAQRECEEKYLEAQNPEIQLFPERE